MREYYPPRGLKYWTRIYVAHRALPIFPNNRPEERIHSPTSGWRNRMLPTHVTFEGAARIERGTLDTVDFTLDVDSEAEKTEKVGPWISTR